MEIIRFKKEATTFTAKAEADTLTLEIYDAIGADWFGQGITASIVSDAMKTAGDYSCLNVRLNSPGGDLFEGVAIYNLFRSCGKPVNVSVDGLAASAASLVAMAGDTITMGVGTQMMIHRAMGGAMGYADDMRKLADILDSVSASAADIYVTRTGMKKDKVMKLMDAETWMSANEALDSGFATAVSEHKAQNVAGRFDLSMFKNTPVSLQVKTKRVDGEDLTAGDFIWVGNYDKVDTWALPWHFSTDEKTKSHLRDALARFDQEDKIPESEKPEAHAKLVRLCKEHGIEVSESPTAEADDPLINIYRKKLTLLRG